MKPARRWPLHPAPQEGEALSSWLHRIAVCYRMDVRDLLESDLSHAQVDDLDIAPPPSLLTALSQRSGIELDKLRLMSLTGWTPWLLDSLDAQMPDALETYTLQFSVLLPRRKLKVKSVTHWRAWMPNQPILRACPLCLSHSVNQALLLVWKLPLMLSCPIHGCWLESYWGLQGQFFSWDDDNTTPRQVNETIAKMDRRTWQAFITGFVDLPRRRIHAAIWFRLLRTLLEELNTPISRCGSHAKSIREIWERSGHPLRAGQSQWRPYELLKPATQLQMLEAAAIAIDMIELNLLNPRGEQAALFLPEPQSELSNGQPTIKRNTETVDYWQEALSAINEAFNEAKHNPEMARSLFALAAFGRDDTETMDRLRVMLIKEGIPAEFLVTL